MCPQTVIQELCADKQHKDEGYWNHITTIDITQLQGPYFIPHPFKNHIKVAESCFIAFSFSIRLDNLCPPPLD